MVTLCSTFNCMKRCGFGHPKVSFVDTFAYFSFIKFDQLFVRFALHFYIDSFTERDDSLPVTRTHFEPKSNLDQIHLHYLFIQHLFHHSPPLLRTSHHPASSPVIVRNILRQAHHFRCRCTVRLYLLHSSFVRPSLEPLAIDSRHYS
jgi:hypothetical protein